MSNLSIGFSRLPTKLGLFGKLPIETSEEIFKLYMADPAANSSAQCRLRHSLVLAHMYIPFPPSILYLD